MYNRSMRRVAVYEEAPQKDLHGNIWLGPTDGKIWMGDKITDKERRK